MERAVSCDELPVYALDGAAPWHVRVLAGMKRLVDVKRSTRARAGDAAADAGSANDAMHAYEVLVELSCIFLELVRNMPSIVTSDGDRVGTRDALAQRMQAFLGYIAAHFAEDVRARGARFERAREQDGVPAVL